jgi:hypothetical protein
MFINNEALAIFILEHLDFLTRFVHNELLTVLIRHHHLVILHFLIVDHDFFPTLIHVVGLAFAIHQHFLFIAKGIHNHRVAIFIHFDLGRVRSGVNLSPFTVCVESPATLVHFQISLNTVLVDIHFLCYLLHDHIFKIFLGKFDMLATGVHVVLFTIFVH